MNHQKSFDTTLSKIKTRGYWRVEFYPTEFVENAVGTLLRCKEVVNDASVHFRGWDIPHIATHTDDKQSMYAKDSNRYESWIDWHIFKEVWRFYKSGKFTFLDSLYEHWYDEFDSLGPNPLPDLEPGTVVDVINVIYNLTEFMYFFHNVAPKLPDIKGWTIKISLNNVEGNRLATLDRGRMPMSMAYVSHTESMSAIDLEVSNADLKNTKTCLKLAKEGAQAIFQNFEWQAADALIDGEQEKLISRRF